MLWSVPRAEFRVVVAVATCCVGGPGIDAAAEGARIRRSQAGHFAGLPAALSGKASVA